MESRSKKTNAKVQPIGHLSVKAEGNDDDLEKDKEKEKVAILSVPKEDSNLETPDDPRDNRPELTLRKKSSSQRLKLPKINP
eukprot:CAMPEP_0115043448 /NCGR_PEP_ID=MMETSP0216-20121206/46877_1 /TAXON_ID=223996 /ORGANISM="Protocruzia adherens, Strain Boccale" /LENGTH=81 /DNA_ID=CAMNT_0002425775 /DNA_START=533 /DNA_END=778 /DNA_ORIENTATION=-